MNMFVSLEKVSDDKDIKALRKLLDQTETTIRNLGSLDVKPESYGTLLIPLINDKLPDSIRLNIAKKFDNDLWDIETFIKLLQKEIEAKERCFPIGASFNSFENSVKNDNEFSSAALFIQNSRENCCVFCNKRNHSSVKCLKITDPKARKAIIKEKHLCFLCLKNDHTANSCKIKYSCHKCGGKHNIAICTFSQNSKFRTKNHYVEQTTTTNFSENMNSVLLQTATVSVCENKTPEKTHNVQLLFDSGSQRSFISEKLRNKLKLPLLRTEKLLFNTFGTSQPKTEIVDIVPLKFILPHRTIEIECISTSFICNDVLNQNTQVVSSHYPHLKNLVLADSMKSDRKEVNILIGAEHYYQFIFGNIIKGGINEPVAVNSVFGWVLSGRYNGLSTTTSNLVSTHLLRVYIDKSQSNLIKNVLEDTFELKNHSDSAVSKFSDNNLNFDDSNRRYVCRLPFIRNPKELPDNFQLAKIRTLNLLKSLKRDPELLVNYDNIINDYIKEGILEEVPLDETYSNVHYLPHRPVVKEERETTKTRIVFDASAKCKNNPSLNDLLEPGPCLLPFIFDLLVRFRLGKIGIVSDITKAFLQISIENSHRNYLSMIWFNDFSNPASSIKILRFTRLVFGLTSSPFVLNATLKIHLNQYLSDKNLKPNVEKLLKDLYVDDITTCVDNLTDGKKFYDVSKSCLASANFVLGK